MTPFYLKPEFYAALCGGITGVLTCCGVFTGEQASEIGKCVSQIAGGAITLISIIKYMSEQGKARATVFHELCQAARAANGKGCASTMSSSRATVLANAEAAGL